MPPVSYTAAQFARRGQPFCRDWTMTHSWYVIMGGFVFETHDPNEPEFIPGSPTLVLTETRALLLSQKCRLSLPQIKAEAILDCSKADTVAKTLVCIQAAYLIVQCACRLAAKLSISPLEVNTLGHVLCALLMYSFWFSKPKDIRVTTPIREPWSRPACALLWMCTTLSNLPETGEPEFESLGYYPNLTTNYPLCDPGSTGWRRHVPPL